MSFDLDHVRRLHAFHHWATDLAMDAVSSISAEQLDQKWGGSFATGRGLLQHVLGAERLWVDRFHGVTGPKLQPFPATHSGHDFRDEWEKIKGDEKRFIDGLTPGRITGSLSYINIKGEHKSFPWETILVHVVNHGTYHRGQITHLLRDLGLPAPTTDYLYFPGAAT